LSLYARTPGAPGKAGDPAPVPAPGNPTAAPPRRTSARQNKAGTPGCPRGG